MAGGVGDHVGLRPVGVRQVVVHGVEQDARHHPPGGDRAPRVARHGHVVEHQGAQRPVDEIQGLELPQLLGREGGLGLIRGEAKVDVAPAAGSELVGIHQESNVSDSSRRRNVQSGRSARSPGG